MDTRSFNAYKTRYRTAIRKVLAEAEKGHLDEAAFPAYSHRNPYINHLFWQRVRKVMEYIERPERYEDILDFGCGSGVLLSFLADISKRVIALDVDVVPLSKVQEHIPLAPNVEVFHAATTSHADLPKGSFDLILALDVLEHVQDLPSTINELFAHLKPGGKLIVSGPTENILYRLGRKLAGSEYSGAYHERNIAEIKAIVAKFGPIKPITKIYWYLPLFEIFSMTRKE